MFDIAFLAISIIYMYKYVMYLINYDVMTSLQKTKLSVFVVTQNFQQEGYKLTEYLVKFVIKVIDQVTCKYKHFSCLSDVPINI